MGEGTRAQTHAGAGRRVNDKILTRDMNVEMAGERRERFGIADPAFAHAVSLNDLDDWDQTHRRLANSAASSPAG